MLLNRIPWPLNDGGAIGAYHFVRGYADAGCDVTCLAMNTTKHFVYLNNTGNAFTGIKQFVTIPIDNNIKPLPAIKSLFTNSSYIISRFYNKAFEQALIKLLIETPFDIVHIDGLPPGLYIDVIRQNSTAKISYRAHNVEYMIWERGANADTNPLKKWYLGIQARRLKQFETNVLAKVDTVLAISKEDEGFLKALAPQAKTIVVPAGLNIDQSKPIIQPAKVSLFFIGALDWLPNLQGLDWFLKDIWPQIHEAFPDLQFHIAGKKMPQQFYKYEKLNVVAHGEVPSAIDFMNQHSVLLSPLVSGSGVRIKIIEAMAIGKVVLSTTIAAEGSSAINGENILIADNADAYISAIKKLITDPTLLSRLSNNARNFALENFQNKNIIARLIEHYKKLCN